MVVETYKYSTPLNAIFTNILNLFFTIGFI